MGIAQATSFAISVKMPPLSLLLEPPFFFGAAKNSRIGGEFCQKCFFWTVRQNLVSFAFFGALGCRVPWQFCGGRCHTLFFLSRQVHVLASKNSKYADLGRKPYVSISGFLWRSCRRFSKVKIHLPMVKIEFWSVLSTHPRPCRPFLP